jgi:chromatin assembly factor 1 subunit B
VFAVLTLSEVAVYDTAQQAPLIVAKNLHYAALTDAAWSADGR